MVCPDINDVDLMSISSGGYDRPWPLPQTRLARFFSSVNAFYIMARPGIFHSLLRQKRP